jgi:pyruvate/2-oxoglutarate dehydrogenase complex dihydrolipoamide acyltransferase (E2) component
MVRGAASALSQQSKWPVMIACGRHVIAEPDAKQPQAIDSLRGADRDIAEALVHAGYHVAVRACIAAIPNYNEPPRWPETGAMWSITRLKTVPPLAVLEGMDDEGVASEIEDYVLDSIAIDQWVVRKSAAATLVHENGCWAEDGMAFGNEGYEALLYTLAALEVTTSKAKPAAKPKAKPAAKPRPKAKAKAVAKPRKAKSKAKAKAKPKRR